MARRKENDNFIKRIARKYGKYIPVVAGLTAVGVSMTNNNNENDKNVDFAIVSITDDKLPKEFFTYLEEGKPISLVVSPTGCRYADVYKTIDFLKEVISEFNIEGPIFYDVENDELSNDSVYTRANVLLGEEFCNKMTANGCYVGFYGSDEAISEYEDEFREYASNSFDDYDKLIVVDSNEINYDGIYNMSMNESGEITTKIDVVNTIKELGLNKEEKFVDDITYIVKKGDSIKAIAEKFGMKPMDLALYNDLADTTKDEFDIIYPGDKIKIPNRYNNAIEIEDLNDSYTVVVGDSIESIAKTYNVDSDEFAKLNDLYDENGKYKIIYPGDILKIPTSSTNQEQVEQKVEVKSDTTQEMDLLTYQVKAGDSIEAIASAHYVDADEFAKLNDLYDENGKYKIIYPGDILKIPESSIAIQNLTGTISTNEESKKVSTEENQVTTTTNNGEYIKIIDVSYHQGDIDWKKVKESNENICAMLRICDFVYDNFDDNELTFHNDFSISDEDIDVNFQRKKDENGKFKSEGDIQFLENLKGCIENDIPFGIYWYSHAKTVEEAKREAEVVVNTLDNTFGYVDENGQTGTISIDKIALPIYMDVEASELQEMCKKGYYGPCLDAAMQVLKENGYIGGLYCNATDVTDESKETKRDFWAGTNDNLLTHENLISYAYNKGYELWIVNNFGYNIESVDIKSFDLYDEKEYYNRKDDITIPYVPANFLREGINVAQFTENGHCEGIDRSVDIDYLNPNLLEKVEKSGLNKVGR